MNSVSEPVTLSRRVGRFAPSPTGPLHLGSLVAAAGSYLDARTTGGQWLLRIEDVDRPRSVPGMVDTQLSALDAYGFEWAGEVLRQSERSAIYQATLDSLIAQGLAYPCHCTRSQIAGVPGARRGIDGVIYPGTCAAWAPGDPVPATAAWRFRVPGGIFTFRDRIRGDIAQNLVDEVGDFPLLRADGCFTYQLAVVVDDLAQGVTDIVRGADLVDSSPRQMALIQALGGAVPTYAHLPVVINAAGKKLSKQTRAEPIPVDGEAQRVPMLWQVLAFLGQQPPAELRRSTQRELWAWALAHWQIARVPGGSGAPAA